MNKEKIEIISKEIIDTLVEKTKHYGDSWKSRGGAGAFMNIARKWDRLENQCKKNKYDIFESIQSDKKGEEGVRDSLVDLIGYGLLILSETSDISSSLNNDVSNDAPFKTGYRKFENPFGFDEEIDN